MKKSILIVAALAVVAFGCKKIENGTSVNMVKATMSVASSGTKTDISETGVVTWVSGDAMSVFTNTDAEDGMTNYNFFADQISSDAKSAIFSGDVADNPSRSMVYVVYPYDETYDGTSLTEFSVSVPASQTGEVSQFALMAGKSPVDGNDFSKIKVGLTPLTWIYDITVNNPEAKAVKAVYFVAGSPVFASTGTIDLTADVPAVTPVAFKREFGYTFDAPMSEETLKARLVLLPVDCEITEFNIDVVFEDESYERFSMGEKALETEAGSRYTGTVTLGEGTPGAGPKGYYLVKKGTKINDAYGEAAKVSDDVVKLWLESSPSEAYQFSQSDRIRPTKSLVIASDPENIRPVVTQKCKATVTLKKDTKISDLEINHVSFFADNSLGEAWVLLEDETGMTGVEIDRFTVTDCEFNNYKHGFLKIANGISGGVKIDEVFYNNNVWVPKSTYDAGNAFINIPNNTDKVRKITVSNSTFVKVLCLMYCNMNSSSGVNLDYTVQNNTFGNGLNKSNANNYFMSLTSGTIKGVIKVSDNMFVGSNAITATSYRLLRVGSLTNLPATMTNNWYTESWFNFTLDTSDTKYLNFLTDKSEYDNDVLAPEYANNDFTLKKESGAANAKAGDPRWRPF